jgi:hypothetical protein
VLPPFTTFHFLEDSAQDIDHDSGTVLIILNLHQLELHDSVMVEKYMEFSFPCGILYAVSADSLYFS